MSIGRDSITEVWYVYGLNYRSPRDDVPHHSVFSIARMWYYTGLFDHHDAARLLVVQQIHIKGRSLMENLGENDYIIYYTFTCTSKGKKRMIIYICKRNLAVM